MPTNNLKYQREYMNKYINAYYGYYSTKISNIKRSAKVNNDIPKSRLTLTTDEFLEILEKFSFACCYCGQTNIELVPSMIVRFSHNGSLSRSNTVPSCSKCNRHKLSQTSHKSFEKWYKSQPFYSQERYNKIINHIKRE